MNEASEKGGAFDAVVFDLLTALIDSWTLWNDVAGSEEDGMRWRKEYLQLTYGAAAYRDYETIVTEAADAAGIAAGCAQKLAERWDELSAWPEVPVVLRELSKKARLGACPSSRLLIAGESDSFAGHEQTFSSMEDRPDAAAACVG